MMSRSTQPAAARGTPTVTIATARLVSSLALAALLGACGGDAQPDPGASSGAEAAPAPEGVYGTAPAAMSGTPSVITLRGGPAASPAPQPVMDQLGLVFAPTTLIAKVGEPMQFTNSETIVHNVRLTHNDTDATVLDVETDPTQRVEFTFTEEGGYHVTCDHHPGMRAFIYATTAERAVVADNAGRFTLPSVPPGSYTLSVWTVDPARRSERTLEVTGPSTEVTLP